MWGKGLTVCECVVVREWWHSVWCFVDQRPENNTKHFACFEQIARIEYGGGPNGGRFVGGIRNSCSYFRDRVGVWRVSTIFG